MAYSDFIQNPAPSVVEDWSSQGDFIDIKFTKLRAQIKAALDAIEANFGGGGAGTITTGMLANRAVTKAKINMLQTSEITGNGGAQVIPHGLGAVPAIVLVTITSIPAAYNFAGSALTITEGAHDGTNLIFTAPTNVKYKAIAIA